MTNSLVHTITRYALRLLTALVLVLGVGAGLTMGAPVEGHAAPAPADAPVDPVPGMAVYLSDAACAHLGLPATGTGQCVTDTTHVAVVAIAVPDGDDTVHPGTEALLAAGYTGEAGDQLNAIYAPVDTVVFDESGTWTVTVAGLARCEHGTVGRCTGAEWIGLHSS